MIQASITKFGRHPQQHDVDVTVDSEGQRSKIQKVRGQRFKMSDVKNSKG